MSFIASLKAVVKLFLFLASVILIAPLQALTLVFSKHKYAYALPLLWHNFVCRLFGIKIYIKGHPQKDRQALYVSNHLSYLDIPAISTILPLSFVAKADVADWPLFGTLAKLQQTAFISRKPQDALKGKESIQKRIEQGHSLILFPEGTSTDGTKVLPFKSSLFAFVMQNGQDKPQNSKNLLIQPFTIKLAQINGEKPSSADLRDIYCWYGDMTLMPHLWHFCKNKGVTLELIFHPPFHSRDYTDRKKLAHQCQKEVAKGL